MVGSGNNLSEQHRIGHNQLRQVRRALLQLRHHSGERRAGIATRDQRIPHVGELRVVPQLIRRAGGLHDGVRVVRRDRDGAAVGTGHQRPRLGWGEERGAVAL